NTARPRYFLFPWSVKADPSWLRSVLTVDDCVYIGYLPKQLNPPHIANWKESDLAGQKFFPEFTATNRVAWDGRRQHFDRDINPGCFRRHNVFWPPTRRSLLASQLQPHAGHGAARIREDGRTSEIRAVQIVRRQTLLGLVIEH